MKADLYVQGHYWATIDLPGDSLLALLAKGILLEATAKADELRADLESIEGVQCSINLRYKGPLLYDPADINAP